MPLFLYWFSFGKLTNDPPSAMTTRIEMYIYRRDVLFKKPFNT